MGLPWVFQGFFLYRYPVSLSRNFHGFQADGGGRGRWRGRGGRIEAGEGGGEGGGKKRGAGEGASWCGGGVLMFITNNVVSPPV